jgi:hypothetical protein
VLVTRCGGELGTTMAWNTGRRYEERHEVWW